MVINALKKAFKVVKPQILNSDQGCQFTSQQYIDFVKENGIRQSMDGKSRWADNIMIERWFRSFKYKEAYLTQYNNIKEARAHTIHYGMSNARIEATNNKIKLIIRKAYGFRNIQNMLDMVYLVCSDIRIPLPNRKLNAA